MSRVVAKRAVEVILCMAVSIGSAFAQGAKPTVFVGPQMRDGFADIDSGIRDSIRDIRQELQTSGIGIAKTQDEATVALLVLGRGIVAQGSVGVASGSLGFGYVVPNTVPSLTIILRVGLYERRMQSDGGTWRAAAKTVVEDVTAWWEANADAVRTTR